MISVIAVCEVAEVVKRCCVRFVFPNSYIRVFDAVRWVSQSASDFQKVLRKSPNLPFRTLSVDTL